MSPKENICLIGMSSVGKTHWAKLLEKAGYTRITCDDLIIKDIFQTDASNSDSFLKLSEWLSYPWSEGFEEREKAYFDSEVKNMQYILDLEHAGPTVIDSAGSVIYCPESILAALKNKYLMLYFSVTKKRKEELVAHYLDCPRPVIWNKTYERISDENKISDHFKKQYLELIKNREVLYKKYADIEIDSGKLAETRDAEELLNLIERKL